MTLTNDNIYLIQEVLSRAEEEVSRLSGTKCVIVLRFIDIPPPVDASKDVVALAKEVASQFSGQSIADLESESRKIMFTLPRFMAWRALRKICPSVSLKEIGLKFGKRDHATVLHGLKSIDNLIETNETIHAQYLLFESFFAGQLEQLNTN